MIDVQFPLLSVNRRQEKRIVLIEAVSSQDRLSLTAVP